MKKVAFGIACGLVSVYVAILMLTLFGRAARQSETEYMLAQAIGSSLSGVMQKENHVAADNGELVVDFLKSLLIQANSDSDIQVSILDADSQKGILSVEITEKYRHPNGKEGSVSQVRTVIFDRAQEKEAKYHKVSFYTASDEIYKEYRLQEDSVCSIPVPPQKEGKRFVCWRFITGGIGQAEACGAEYAGGKKLVLASGGAPYTVSEDTKLIAVFE